MRESLCLVFWLTVYITISFVDDANARRCFLGVSVFQASVSVCLASASGWHASAPVSPRVVPSFHCLGLGSSASGLCLPRKNASAKSVQGLLQDFGYGGQCPLAAWGEENFENLTSAVLYICLPRLLSKYNINIIIIFELNDTTCCKF